MMHALVKGANPKDEGSPQNEIPAMPAGWRL
jgi:hypothetical protein